MSSHEDRYGPAGRRSGSEPSTARSALGLRRGLAVFGALVCALAGVWLAALAAGSSGERRGGFAAAAGLAFALVLVAVVDLVVLSRRRRG